MSADTSNAGDSGADSMIASDADWELASTAPAREGAPPELPGAAPSDAETLASFTAWAAGLFYLAEVGENAGVNDYWDAFHYVATSLSVGYANIFPVTPAGK